MTSCSLRVSSAPTTLAAAQETLWLHVPHTRGVLRRSGCARLARRGPVGRHHQGTVAILGPEPSGLSSRPREFDPGGALPRRRTDLRLYESELWAKYAGVVDYAHNHRRDFANHTLVVPKRSDPATQIINIDPALGRRRRRRPDQGRSAPRRRRRPLLAERRSITATTMWANYVPAGAFAAEEVSVTGAAGTLFTLSHRRPAPWIEHDCRARSARFTLSAVRRVGAALDRQSRLGRARDQSRLA